MLQYFNYLFYRTLILMSVVPISRNDFWFNFTDDSDGKAGGSSLLGVVVGLLVFSALICFGLRLSTASRPRHFPTTNLYPNKLLCSRQTSRSPHIDFYGLALAVVCPSRHTHSLGWASRVDRETKFQDVDRWSGWILLKYAYLGGEETWVYFIRKRWLPDFPAIYCLIYLHCRLIILCTYKWVYSTLC